MQPATARRHFTGGGGDGWRPVSRGAEPPGYGAPQVSHWPSWMRSALVMLPSSGIAEW